MKRRDFFKNFGAGVAVSVVAPNILLDNPVSVVEEQVFGNEGLWHQLRKAKTVPYEGITKQHIKEAVEYVFRNYTPPKYILPINEIKHYYMLNGITYTTV